MPEPSVISVPLADASRRFNLVGIEQSAFFQVGKVEQVGITGENRKRLVGRIAVARGSEGADLPPGETSRSQKVDKLSGVSTSRPNGSVAGQRSEVK